MKQSLALIAAAASLIPSTTSAQPAPAQPRTDLTLTYADLADLATSASITAQIYVRKVTKISVPAATNSISTKQRLLVEADVKTVLRGVGPVQPRIQYLYDAPRDGRGKIPKLVKSSIIIFAVPVLDRPNDLQLVAPDAHIASTPQTVAIVRSILTDVSAPGAPPEVTGVGNAFHVAGALQGEGESQIFLISADGRPLSFNIVRNPGAPPLWSVSVDELVDANAAQPMRDSFLWYRLACALPPVLPRASMANATADDIAKITEDYETVKAGLGICSRNRQPR